MSVQRSETVRTAAARGGLLVVPLLLLLLGCLWGASFSIAKLAIGGGIPVLGYAAWQALGSALVLLVILLVRRLSLPRGWKVWRFCLIAGFVGICVPNLIFYIVISHLPAGLMAVVVATAPIITYSLALSLAMERGSRLRSLGIGLGFVGALVIILPSKSLPEDLDILWLLLAFATPASYALSNLYTARARPQGQSNLAMACGMLLCAGTIQTLLMVSLIPPYLPLPPWRLAEAALFAQIAISSVAYVILFYIVQAAGAVYFSQVGYIVTVAGLIWGMIFFGEQHSAWVYAGTALILGGFTLVNARRGPKPSAAK